MSCPQTVSLSSPWPPCPCPCWAGLSPGRDLPQQLLPRTSPELSPHSAAPPAGLLLSDSSTAPQSWPRDLPAPQSWDHDTHRGRIETCSKSFPFLLGKLVTSHPQGRYKQGPWGLFLIWGGNVQKAGVKMSYQTALGGQGQKQTCRRVGTGLQPRLLRDWQLWVLLMDLQHPS